MATARLWLESTAVLRTFLAALVRGTLLAAPRLVGGSLLLGGLLALAFRQVFPSPLVISAIDLTIGATTVTAFYLAVGAFGGGCLALHQGLVCLLECIQCESERLLGPAVDRLLAQLPLDCLDDADPRALLADLRQRVSVPLGGGALLERKLNHLVAGFAAEKSGRLLDALSHEPNLLPVRERLRRALFDYAAAQHRASLHAGKYVIAGVMTLLWATPPVVLSLIGA